MAGAGNFLITSNYPTDKIIWTYEDTLTTDEYGVAEITIPHSLGVTIYATGIWTDDDWNTTYLTSTSTHEGQVYSRFSQLYSTNSVVYFRMYATNPDGTELVGATIKIRLWAFFNEATTQNVFAPETASVSANKFVKDSRLGYPKLFMEGYADATQQTQIIYHNLGYIPLVEIWYELSGKWYQLDYIDFPADNTSWTVRNTNSTLEFNGDSYTNYNYYFRIYADE